jgi:hypothetical protein
MAAMNSVETFRWQRGYSLEKVFRRRREFCARKLTIAAGWQRISDGSKALLVEEGMWKQQSEYSLHVIAQSRR